MILIHTFQRKIINLIVIMAHHYLLQLDKRKKRPS